MNTLIGRQDPVDETSETLRLAMINLQIATDKLKASTAKLKAFLDKGL